MYVRGWFEMSISVKLIFQFYTELELLKVAAGTIDPTPTLLGLTREIKQYFIAIEYIVRLNISNLTVHNRNLFKINFLKMCYEAGLS